MECKLSESEISAISNKVAHLVYEEMERKTLYDAAKKKLEAHVDAYMGKSGDSSLHRNILWEIIEPIVKGAMRQNFNNIDDMIENAIDYKIGKLLNPEALNENALRIAKDKVSQLERLVYDN